MVCVRLQVISTLQYSIPVLNLSLTRRKFFGKNAIFQIFPETFYIQQCCFWADVYISSCADRVFIYGSNDAISMLIGAGVQKIQCNTLHYPTEKRLKMSSFGPPCGSGRG